ncbi:thioredoxin-like domain-containing protein [Lentibacillus amyloliquefaciens]|uniref:Thiol-disulfide oxidoreductase n=1 Tax=Lentibacillus amyloliquefaciens TaxID=1472767 RepID=A0A0U3WBW4_9BACI|nr:thioredoxin-like domain-containing protein [Lentibacillus amyloliquefaciens]ALX47327.1 thiol-disulfide oxidoreductase [Lentibacillus amyloliquefaciens]
MRLRDHMPELDGGTGCINSKLLSKMDLSGKIPVLIYFWSVSCETCKKAIPKVNEFCNNYDGRLNIIALHMPRTERDRDFEAVRRAAKEHDISQPILVDNDHKLTNQFKNRYVPAYYLFDQKGRLRHKHSGNGGMQMLEKRINKIITETS